MLKIKTTLKESAIHGIGLFSDEFIPSGSLIFEEDEFTIHIYKNEYQIMNEQQKEFIEYYCYFDGNYWKCSMDNDRFMNHSDTPNTYDVDDKTYARVNIYPGEEITCNYNDICESWKNQNK